MVILVCLFVKELEKLRKLREETEHHHLEEIDHHKVGDDERLQRGGGSLNHQDTNV